MDENQKYEDQNQTEDVEEKKSPAEELRGELIENAIILGLAFCILIVATIIKNNNVTRWLYTLSFVFSGYEILYLSIVKLCKKALIIEEISILISGLILLYCGQNILSCLIVLLYSVLRTALKFITYKVENTAEYLQTATEYESDITVKKQLNIRACSLKLALAENYEQGNSYKLKFGIIIVAIGLLVSFIPPIFSSDYISLLTTKWLPCGAATVAVAQVSTFFVTKAICYLSAFLNADRNGVIYGSSKAIEFLAKSDNVIFDKTGVVTEKTAVIDKVTADNVSKVLSLLYSAEKNINNELCSAVSRYSKENSIDIEDVTISKLKFIENKGVIADIADKTYVIGNKKLINDIFAITTEENRDLSVIYIANEIGIQGTIYLKYIEKPNIEGVVNELSLDLNKKTCLLSSDNLGVVNKLKIRFGFNKAIAGASSEYKSRYVKENGAVYIGDSEYDKEVIKLLSSNCVTIGCSESGDIGASVEGTDIRELPTLFKLATRTTKKIKTLKTLTVILNLAVIALNLTLSILAPLYLWTVALGILIVDITLLSVALSNLSETV